MISELHAWATPTAHFFVGTLNDQATEAELIAADEEILNGTLTVMRRQHPELEFELVTEGAESWLQERGTGRKFLSFFRSMPPWSTPPGS